MSDNIFKYEDDIVWSLPCLFQYEAVFGAIQHFVQMLGFNYFKAELYGAPATIWSGGRKPVIYDKLNAKLLSNLFEYVRKYNATPTIAFNCTDIKKEDLSDEYANLILDVALEYNCKFMVYSDLLKDYIKNKKADAYIISSVLKPVFYFQGPNRIENPQIERETEFYNNLLKDYDMVALRSEYSKFALTQNTTLIKDLSRVQILVNNSCLCNCNAAAEHAKHNENFKTNQNYEYEFICPKSNLNTFVKYQNNSMHTQEEIRTLLKAGVNNFKLKGRGGSTTPYMISKMLTSQILNIDGPNYLAATAISEDNIKAETQYFNQVLAMQ